MSFFSRLSRGAQSRAQNSVEEPVSHMHREGKASRTGPLMALYGAGRPKWTDRTYAALAREGFEKNAIVYRAVRMVAEAAASVPWLMFDGRQEIVDHPFLDAHAQSERGGAGLSGISARASLRFGQCLCRGCLH